MIRPYDAPHTTHGQAASVYRGRHKTTMRGHKYIDVVLNIRLPTLQSVLKIPLERAFLAHGRINAPPHPHQVAKIGVGIGILS